MFLMLSSSLAWGVTIKFPEEELATESVLPLFDNTQAVRDRYVKTAKKLEIGGGIGFALNEPWFQTQRYSGHLGFQFNESHGVLLTGQSYQPGISQSAVNLFNSRDIDGEPASFVFNFAPAKRYNIFLNYLMTPFYGKMSLTKNGILSLSLYGYFGAGVVGIGELETKNSVAGTIGFGQKFYAGRRVGIRTDFGFVGYSAPNYIDDVLRDQTDISSDDITQEVPVSAFESQFNIDFQFTISLFVLI